MKKGQYQILIGDCRETMKSIDDNSINCCVTSPPYFGLRDYNNENQIGLETSLDEYIENITTVFDEIHRVLKSSGSLWLNLGDSYDGNNSRTSKGRAGYGAEREGTFKRGGDGLKNKDLIGVPWRVALALQSRGWYLRQDIIWNKGNPMPESVTDRCTKAHEYIFLLTKSPKYYYDAESIKEPCSQENLDDHARRTKKMNKSDHGGERPDLNRNRDDYIPSDGMRNKRSVWNVNTRPYPGAHFAVFPPDLIKPCILAGCPEGGTVIDPFGGSGTTAGVAINYGRDAIMCELNPEYAGLIDARVKSIQPEQGNLI